MAGPILCTYGDPGSLTYLTDDQGDECVSFIRRHRAKPFFLIASFAAPHTPMQAIEEDLKRFDHIDDKLRRTYCAMVYRLDQNVGKILDELRKQDIGRDTIVVFLSDNGGQNAPGMSNGAVNAPFRGGKTTVLEGGIRVPMLLRWPAGLDAGTTVDVTVSALDLLPTLIGAAGGSVDARDPLDGVNLLPFLTGKSDRDPHHALMWRYTVGMARRDRTAEAIPARMKADVALHRRHGAA